MGAGILSADLTQRLNAERDALKSFITLLQTEQQALIDGNIEPLEGISDSKIRGANELGQLTNERIRYLQDCGAEAREGGIISWLQEHAAESLPAWQEVQQLIEQVRYLNTINGTLIQSRLRHNQQALAVLHNAASTAGGLYGRDGQPHLPSAGRTLGSG